MLDPRTVACLLGGVVAGRNRISAPGPGHSPRDRSLSIKLDHHAAEGFVLFSHAGDDWKECRDYVRERMGLPTWEPGDEQDRRVPASKIERYDHAAVDTDAEEAPRPWTKEEINRINRARAIWHEAKDPRGTLAEIYLRNHRKLKLTDNLAGTVLRYHGACPWRDEDTDTTIFVPALIGAFRSIDNNTITAIHRVRLNVDGSKADRRMYGIAHRTAVKLAPANGTLAVGEGIETCMAAQQLGFAPAWALGSAGGIAKLPVIDGVNTLIILGEAGEVSARAVSFCSERWLRAGRQMRVVTPEDGFSDLNDELMARVK